MAFQYATASLFGSSVAAFHPVNAVVIFLVAITAARRGWVEATGSPDAS